MAATVTRQGKKKIITNDGSVQIDLNSNRILHYDQSKFRFLIGQKTSSTTPDSKVLMSKEGENVLDA